MTEIVLKINRETHLQVEVERMLVALGVERHGGDVVRELGLDIDAYVAREVILQSCGGMNRPLQSLDCKALVIELGRDNSLDQAFAAYKGAQPLVAPEVPFNAKRNAHELDALVELGGSVVGSYIARH